MSLKHLSVLLLSGMLMFGPACSSGTSADTTASESDESLLEKVSEALTGEKYALPADTQMRVQLSTTVSSKTNASGDEFTGILSNDLNAEGKLVAPAGSTVQGYLSDVEDGGKVKGRAHVVMVLESLNVAGEAYSLEAHPLTIRAEKSTKKDAAVIAGSAAVGAVVGAITGGKKGAAIGAGVGGGAGTGYVLTTKGDQVKLGPESTLVFTLSEELRLPEWTQ